MKKALLIFGIVILAFQACRTPFDPEVPASESSILVVEGYLDTEGKASELKLSRTVPLDSQTIFSPVTNASVTLRSQSGMDYDVPETEPGTYLFQEDVDENDSYVLEIILNNGERFQSELMKPIITPDIIDAGFVRDEEGVEVFVTTQGNENADDFLWTYDETWVYRPKIRSNYIYDTDIQDVRQRTEEEQISLCFKNETSPDILLETSSRFQEQVVFRQTITEIPEDDERIMERYSILISQKAIEEDAVKFWEILKKNAEDIGSIFSPLPSLIGGNIKSMDNGNVPVIGQVSMGVVKQRRIYINLIDVVPWSFVDPQFSDCIIGEEPILIRYYQTIFSGGNILPAREYVLGTATVGYYPSYKRCTDCSLYASKIKPDFWEDY